MSSSFIFVLALILMVGCTSTETSSSSADLISQNDFESLDGWLPVPSSVTMERAHSGHYATKIDVSVEYGLGYASTLAKAGLVAGQDIEVSAWALRTGAEANGAIVVQVVDAIDGQQVYWQALQIGEQVKTYNRWMLIKKRFQLPKNALANHQLRVYPWRNQASQPAYFDDIRLLRVR